VLATRGGSAPASLGPLSLSALRTTTNILAAEAEQVIGAAEACASSVPPQQHVVAEQMAVPIVDRLERSISAIASGQLAKREESAANIEFLLAVRFAAFARSA